MEELFLALFPRIYRDRWMSVAHLAPRIQEIRLRLGRPIMVQKADGEWFLGEGGLTLDMTKALVLCEQELERYVNHFCRDSIYAFQEELKNGFMTVPGGHRVGVAGQVILDQGEIKGMKHITFLCVRLSHQIKGTADTVIPYLYEDKQLRNTLIISPPGCGKTTMLRDMVRQISNGNAYGEGVCVSVIDERSEIAGCYLGKPQNDVGFRTDVLDGCPKEKGLMMMLRSMAPKVVAVDELGGKEDEKALHKLSSCGCKIIATVHGEDMEDLKGKMGWENILKEKIFDRYIVLGRVRGIPTVLHIYDREFKRLSLC